MKYELIQDFDGALEILREVGEWMQKTHGEIFESWEPQNLTADTVLDDMVADKDDFYVFKMDDEPVAAFVMSESDMWEMWDDAADVRAIYLAKFGKKLKFKDLKITDTVLNLIKSHAKNTGIDKIRLDTDIDATGLIKNYERNGFKRVGTVLCDGDPRPCAMFECVLSLD